jgi:alkylated DNA repair dioxygenase AlkB
MNYSCDYMDIDIYSEYLSKVEIADLYKKIVENPVHFKHSSITKDGNPSKKRNKTIYGSIPVYSYTYRGKTIETSIYSWRTHFPEHETLTKRIEETTGQSYNTCVIQIYNSGAVDIRPHRDKEMKKGSIIASISIGQTRTMRFERNNYETLDIPLESGTLCLDQRTLKTGTEGARFQYSRV